MSKQTDGEKRVSQNSPEEHKKKIPKKNKKGKHAKQTSHKMLVACLLTAILGVGAGVLYVDSVYGSGKMLAYVKEQMEQIKTNQTKEEKTEQPKEEQSSATVDDHIKSQSENSMETEGTNYFCTFGNRFLMCTKDGVRFYNSMGDQKWNDTFTMASPRLIKEGDYCAVGDMSGKVIHVYSESGKLYSVQTEGTIMQFALNNNGYLIAIFSVEDGYKASVYNETGTRLYLRNEETSGVYPLSADISNDNKVYAISYLDTSDVKPVGRVLLFYIDPQKGKEFQDNMFAALEPKEEEAGQFIPMISFLHNGILGVVTDESVLGIGADGQQVWNYPLNNRIDYVNMENGKYIIVALGDELTGKDGEEKGSVLWIDGEGKKSSTFQAGGNVTYLRNAEESTIVGSGSRFFSVKPNGKVIWEHVVTGEVVDILMMGSDTKALYVTRNRAAVVDITNMNTVTEPVNDSDGEEIAPTEEDTSTEKQEEEEIDTKVKYTEEENKDVQPEE